TNPPSLMATGFAMICLERMISSYSMKLVMNGLVMPSPLKTWQMFGCKKDSLLMGRFFIWKRNMELKQLISYCFNTLFKEISALWLGRGTGGFLITVIAMSIIRGPGYYIASALPWTMIRFSFPLFANFMSKQLERLPIAINLLTLFKR